MVLGVWCPVIPGIRNTGPDHHLSRLLVQEPHVLTILCILFIDVSKCNKPVLPNLSLLHTGHELPLFHSRMIRSARGAGPNLSENSSASGFCSTGSRPLTVDPDTPSTCPAFPETG